MRVTRGSFSPDWIGPVRASASMIIERNFSASKPRPLRPTRSCEKNTGPRSSILMSAAITAQSGAEMISPPPDSIMSSSRFAMPRHCHHFAVQRERVVNHPLDGKRRGDPRIAAAPIDFCRSGSASSRSYRFAERDGVARGNDISRLAVAIHPSDASSKVSADDGFAGSHRFELHDAEGFLARHRRQDEDMARPIQRRELVVRDGAHKPDALGDAKRAERAPRAAARSGPSPTMSATASSPVSASSSTSTPCTGRDGPTNSTIGRFTSRRISRCALQTRVRLLGLRPSMPNGITVHFELKILQLRGRCSQEPATTRRCAPHETARSEGTDDRTGDSASWDG